MMTRREKIDLHRKILRELNRAGMVTNLDRVPMARGRWIYHVITSAKSYEGGDWPTDSEWWMVKHSPRINLYRCRSHVNRSLLDRTASGRRLHYPGEDVFELVLSVPPQQVGRIISWIRQNAKIGRSRSISSASLAIDRPRSRGKGPKLGALRGEI